MKRKNEAGQAVIFALLAIFVLLGFAGLAVDMGVLRYDKRLQQTAADSAAIAGASNFAYGGVTAGAQNASATNGFTNGTNNVTVTVNTPPTVGPHAGAAGYVEVYVTAIQPTYFMKALGISHETITARAVATNLSGGAGSGCLYTLGSSGNGILMNGSGETISAPGCGIVDDACLTMNGSGLTISAASVGVSCTSPTYNGVSAPANVQTGIPAAADPLAYLTPPSSTCTGNASVTINGSHITQTVAGGDYCGGITINGSGNNVTLNPGVFGSITINGAGQNITFNPGVYVISGSGGVVDNGNSTMTGDGVMFYDAKGPLTLNGNNPLNFSAPTTSNSGTGAVAGLLFWQAPSDTNPITLNGGNSATFNGIVYAPDAQVTINGKNVATAYAIVVAKSLTMNGNSTLNLSANASGLTPGSPIKNAVLVE
jgi:hypothetical protein